MLYLIKIQNAETFAILTDTSGGPYVARVFETPGLNPSYLSTKIFLLSLLRSSPKFYFSVVEKKQINFKETIKAKKM